MENKPVNAINEVRNQLPLEVIEGLFQIDDVTIERFLRAHKFNVDKVVTYLIKAEEWRQQDEIENAKECVIPKSIIASFDLYEVERTDDDGRPVYYIPIGNWGGAYDFYKKGMREDCCNHYTKSFVHQVYKRILKTKKQQVNLIIDMDGLTYRKALREIQNTHGIADVYRNLQEFETFFPEILHRAYVINAPRAFHVGYSLIKPLLTKRTVEKINIFNSGNNSWKNTLAQELPSAAIPQKIGGSGNLFCLF